MKNSVLRSCLVFKGCFLFFASVFFVGFELGGEVSKRFSTLSIGYLKSM